MDCESGLQISDVAVRSPIVTLLSHSSTRGLCGGPIDDNYWYIFVQASSVNRTFE